MAKITRVDSTLTHSFSVALAAKYGLFEALLINHIKHWLSTNEDNDTCYRDGRYWTFQKIGTLEKTYPYVSRRTIERALEKLVDAGVLLKGNYNDSRMNRIMWYSFTDEFRSQIVLMDCDNLAQSDTTDCHSPVRQNDVIKNDSKNNNYYKENDTKEEREDTYVSSRKKFTPPTVDEVEEYCQEMGYGIDPDAFIDHYTTTGWMYGKTHMKDWKAAVRNWERRRKNESKQKQKPKNDFFEGLQNA